MATKSKAADTAKEKAKNPNDYEIEIEITNGVVLRTLQNDDVRRWRKDVYDQLVMWRNLPHPQQIGYGDESVRKIAHARGIENPLQPKGRKEKELMGRIREGVISKAIQERESLMNTVVTLSLLKDAIVFDERNGIASLRPDIHKLIGQELIDDAVERYFANNEKGKYEPIFPTYDTDVPAEHAIVLASLLSAEYPGIGLKIREKLEAIDREIDSLQAAEDAHVVDAAGFQSE